MRTTRRRIATPCVDRFHYERRWWSQGVRFVAGLDEAGRGPLAGPVVAAAVILPANWSVDGLPDGLQGLNDSKQLTQAQRESFFAVIIADPTIRFAIAECSAEEIDRLNILRATHCAMNAALAKLTPSPEQVLVDGLRVPALQFPQTAIVKGDALSYSIAAGSVLAKVTRDRQMLEHHRRWPQYGFAAHKGYGTAAHLAAIEQHGPCPIHRRSFAPIKPAECGLFKKS